MRRATSGPARHRRGRARAPRAGCLQRRGLHASRGSRKRVKEVLAHVPAPERAVAVGGDDAAAVRCAGERLDASPDVVGALQLHAASITDRLRPVGLGSPRAQDEMPERTNRLMRTVLASGGFAVAVGISVGMAGSAHAQATPSPGVAPRPPAPAPAPTPAPASAPAPAPATVAPPTMATATVDEAAPVEVPSDLVQVQPGGLTADQAGARAARRAGTRRRRGDACGARRRRSTRRGPRFCRGSRAVRQVHASERLHAAEHFARAAGRQAPTIERQPLAEWLPQGRGRQPHSGLRLPARLQRLAPPGHHHRPAQRLLPAHRPAATPRRRDSRGRRALGPDRRTAPASLRRTDASPTTRGSTRAAPSSSPSRR